MILKIKRVHSRRYRPEDILIKSDDAGGSGLKGRVTSLQQLGAKTVIDVELGSEKIRVSMPTSSVQSE